MTINREKWTTPFHESAFCFDWLCPKCGIGRPTRKKADNDSTVYTKLLFGPTSETHIEYRNRIECGDTLDDGRIDTEGLESRFTSIYICNNENCLESFVVSGFVTVKRVIDVYPECYDYRERFNSCQPNYIAPSPEIIPLRADYPDTVKAELRKAFIFSWGSFEESLNRIRSSIEALLDHFGEPNKSPDNRFIPLHYRIENAKCFNADQKEKLTAIKILGNEGSHYGQNIIRDDVFDALEILDDVLDKLFSTNPSSMLAQKINAQKGPIR